MVNGEWSIVKDCKVFLILKILTNEKSSKISPIHDSHIHVNSQSSVACCQRQNL